MKKRAGWVLAGTVVALLGAYIATYYAVVERHWLTSADQVYVEVVGLAPGDSLPPDAVEELRILQQFDVVNPVYPDIRLRRFFLPIHTLDRLIRPSVWNLPKR